ncbi:hypothetical protein EVAR_46638_1 [Eumeta japonica]|uniref:Uncharacterized protein n=1 Tax=Eumeta variegata TaxID=151549 RepID=A0A4C1WF15_EUMVA|nr:hypothetical protein EVAR_46638_1 [Eumeta japonica]
MSLCASADPRPAIVRQGQRSRREGCARAILRPAFSFGAQCENFFGRSHRTIYLDRRLAAGLGSFRYRTVEDARMMSSSHAHPVQRLYELSGGRLA